MYNLRFTTFSFGNNLKGLKITNHLELFLGAQFYKNCATAIYFRNDKLISKCEKFVCFFFCLSCKNQMIFDCLNHLQIYDYRSSLPNLYNDRDITFEMF